MDKTDADARFSRACKILERAEGKGFTVRRLKRYNTRQQLDEIHSVRYCSALFYLPQIAATGTVHEKMKVRI